MMIIILLIIIITMIIRRDENSILRRAMELEVEGRRPVDRPKKTLSKVVEELRHEEAKHHRRYGGG